MGLGLVKHFQIIHQYLRRILFAIIAEEYLVNQPFPCHQHFIHQTLELVIAIELEFTFLMEEASFLI